MCGIFGFSLNRPLNDADIALGGSALKLLQHRGPDNEGVWIEQTKGIYLGHRRLSIIDTNARSDQPMIRGNHVIAYNGEVYNYKELRDSLLKSGEVFSTTGDTEVILGTWKQHQANCLNSFDGMFAFALYDGAKLHLAIDAFGEKPLYLAHTTEGIYFSSEPLPLVRLLNLTRKISEEDTALFLSLGFLPAPRTGYERLEKLTQASHLVVEHGQITKRNRYWKLDASPHQQKPAFEKKHLDKFAELLSQSLALRLRADVPLGLFLSSGIDSALVAALAAKELRASPLALSVRFSDLSVFDESSAAQAIAKHLGLEHVVVDSAEDPARSDTHAIFNLYGEINDNLTVAAAYQMSLVAKKHMTVALSGVGGDELCFGYNKYRQLNEWQRFVPTNAALRQVAAKAVRYFPSGKGEFLKVLIQAPLGGEFIAAKNPEVSELFWKNSAIRDYILNFLSAWKDWPLDLAARDFDLAYTLPGTFIPAIERGSMRASLELRTPYLERNLFSFVNQFSHSSFFEHGQKWVLRALLERYVPKALIDQPKRGFNYPPDAFLKTYGDTLPTRLSLPLTDVHTIWDNRFLAGHQKLAVRAAMLEQFLENQQPSTLTEVTAAVG